MTEWISYPNPDAGLKSACGRFRIRPYDTYSHEGIRIGRFYALIDFRHEGYSRRWPLDTTHSTIEEAQIVAERRNHYG